MIQVRKMYKNIISVRKQSWGKGKKCDLKMSLFPDFFQKLKFSVTRSEILWLSLTLKSFFPLAVFWPVATMIRISFTLFAYIMPAAKWFEEMVYVQNHLWSVYNSSPQAEVFQDLKKFNCKLSKLVYSSNTSYVVTLGRIRHLVFPHKFVQCVMRFVSSLLHSPEVRIVPFSDLDKILK